MRESASDYLIIGGGIVGLATAWALTRRFPEARLQLLEKEADWAQHQTGRNSGVIHSGIYYKPGSLKAQLAREGNTAMRAFCAEHGLPTQSTGKLIIATRQAEMPRLEALLARGLENGLDVTLLTREEARGFEPHVRCEAALLVPATGITDYRQVSRKLAELISARGGALRTGAHVTGIRRLKDGYAVITPVGEFTGRYLINCAGLHSDRIAGMAGMRPAARIVPFRGEYYELVPERRHLVRGLIYPVPNPDFPFLGVHFTRMVDGSVHAGPNAVLSLKREGYDKTAFALADALGSLTYPGLWRLAARHWDEGLKEMGRSASKALFVKSLQALVPEIRGEDLVPCTAGVRAQALTPSGAMVDDFLIMEDQRALHVCNSPSPAATASLAIGEAIARRIPLLPQIKAVD